MVNNVLQFTLVDTQAPQQIVLLPGLNRLDVPMIRSYAAEFGWSVKTARNLHDAALLRDAAAVFFSVKSPGLGRSWQEAVRALKRVAPRARLIACHGFAESVDWPSLSDAGAYHDLHVPLKGRELRQCLGFVWASLRGARAHAIASAA